MRWNTLDCKLIALDLDGTFLDDKKNIPPENMAALCRAAEKGIHVAVATGRIHQGVPEAIRCLPFIRYYICINGAQIYDAAEDRMLHTAETDTALALELMEYMDTLPVIYDCYQDGWGWMSRDMYEKAEEYVYDLGILRLVKELRSPVPDLKETVRERGRGLQKQQMYFKMEDMPLRDRLLETLPEKFPELLFTTSVKNNIEVNCAQAAKGIALGELCRLLGIGTEQVLAFGDGSNDTDMLRVAGVGVAMANARPEVKAAADYVTLCNNDAGVAAGIKRFVFGEL